VDQSRVKLSPASSARPMRAIFLGLSSFQALAMFRRGIFYTFLAVYLRANLGLSVTETTLFETIPMVLNVLFQTLVWGRLTDRLQKRRSLIVSGEILAGIGHLAMWFLHARMPDGRQAGWVIIATLSVIEIFWSMSNIGWSAYIADVYEPRERNAIQGRLAAIGGVGRILGAVLGGLLYDGLKLMYPGWGFRSGAIFFVAAGVMFISVIPLLFMPEGGVKKASADMDSSLAAGLKASQNPATALRPGQLKLFVIFLAAMLLINSGVNSVGAFRGQFMDLAEGFATSPSLIALACNVESLAIIVFGLLAGMLGSWLGVRKLLVAGALSGFVSLALHAAAPSLAWVFAAAAFKGAADASIGASSYAFAASLIPPEKRGRWFAAYNATFFLSWGISASFVTGPLIDGLIRRGTGQAAAYRAGFVSAAILVVLGLGLLVALLRTRKSLDPGMKRQGDN